ncbi:Heat shock 70 kDa protein [Taenia solium]|eukprot:TsM_001206700 transcript=TsM_001206700 gene=TsM_001206700
MAIKRSRKVPKKGTRLFSTCAYNQPVVLVQVYEAERAMADDNYLLSKFRLSGILSTPRGELQVEATFDFDANSALSVSAVDKSVKKRGVIIITTKTIVSQKGK